MGIYLVNVFIQKKAEPRSQRWRGLQPHRTLGEPQFCPSRIFTEVDLSDCGPRTLHISSLSGFSGWEGEEGLGGESFEAHFSPNTLNSCCI